MKMIESRFCRVFRNKGGSIKRDANGVTIREPLYFPADEIKEIEAQWLRDMYEDLEPEELERLISERMAELDQAIKDQGA